MYYSRSFAQSLLERSIKHVLANVLQAALTQEVALIQGDPLSSSIMVRLQGFEQIHLLVEDRSFC